MLVNQLAALEEVSCELQKVNSLLTLLGDYFMRSPAPDGNLLETRYRTYSDLVNVVDDIVTVQKKCLDEATTKLFSIREELRKLGDLIG